MTEQPPAATGAPAPTEEKKLTVEELLAQMQAEMKADREENKKAIDLMAQAIVKLNEKIEAKPKEGEGGATDWLKVLAGLAEGDKTSLESFAKHAQAFARAADAVEHFRHPSRIGMGEALLMRLGMRAAFPRYMTKAELARAEKALGLFEAFEEGETEHVL